MILGYSRMRYAEFTTDISTENVINMHLNAFRYFGGYTDTILYDNMKQVVLERKIKASQSVFNRKFRDFFEYCGFVVRLSYPYRPQTKGKIENTIKYVRYNFWTGRTFESLSDINAQCIQWLKRVNSQIHGTTHQISVELLTMEKLHSVERAPDTSPARRRREKSAVIVTFPGTAIGIPFHGYTQEGRHWSQRNLH